MKKEDKKFYWIFGIFSYLLVSFIWGIFGGEVAGYLGMGVVIYFILVLSYHFIKHIIIKDYKKTKRGKK